MHKFKEEELHFYFSENNSVPVEFQQQKLSSKGFLVEATLEDFLRQSKSVFLHITHRRWINETTGIVVTRDWCLVAKGTRMRDEFVTLKKPFLSIHLV